MSNPLANLKFESTSDFIKFKADVPVKARVLSVNPLIHDNTFTDKNTGEVSVSTKYAFAVWNYNEDRAMILDASPSIAQGIHQKHTDEDYGEDITKVDLKITPTGEMLERRYTLDVLPKAQEISADQEKAVKELDAKLDTIIKGGIRAEDYNNGTRANKPDEKKLDTVHQPPEGEEIDLDTIPF